MTLRNIANRRLLSASYFAAEADAGSVVDKLLSGLGFSERELGVAPLVVDCVEGTVVALTAGSEKVDDIVSLAEQHGGRLVADVPKYAATSAHGEHLRQELVRQSQLARVRTRRD